MTGYIIAVQRTLPIQILQIYPHETGLSAEHIKDWFKQPIDRINELCHSDTFTLEDVINRIHRDMMKQNLPKALEVLNVCLGQTDNNFNKIQIERGLERTSSLKKSKTSKLEQMVDGVSGDRQFNPRDTSSDTRDILSRLQTELMKAATEDAAYGGSRT